MPNLKSDNYIIAVYDEKPGIKRMLEPDVDYSSGNVGIFDLSEEQYRRFLGRVFGININYKLSIDEEVKNRFKGQKNKMKRMYVIPDRIAGINDKDSEYEIDEEGVYVEAFTDMLRAITSPVREYNLRHGYINLDEFVNNANPIFKRFKYKDNHESFEGEALYKLDNMILVVQDPKKVRMLTDIEEGFEIAYNDDPTNDDYKNLDFVKELIIAPARILNFLKRSDYWELKEAEKTFLKGYPVDNYQLTRFLLMYGIEPKDYYSSRENQERYHNMILDGIGSHLSDEDRQTYESELKILKENNYDLYSDVLYAIDTYCSRMNTELIKYASNEEEAINYLSNADISNIMEFFDNRGYDNSRKIAIMYYFERYRDLIKNNPRGMRNF